MKLLNQFVDGVSDDSDLLGVLLDSDLSGLDDLKGSNSEWLSWVWSQHGEDSVVTGMRSSQNSVQGVLQVGDLAFKGVSLFFSH